MGAAVVRLLRDFNLEARVQREISRAKPRPAPRHPSAGALARRHEGQTPETPRGAHSDQDERLRRMLRGLHVRASDGQTDSARRVTDPVAPRPPLELRPRREPGTDAAAATCIPKGRISLVEALTLLENHKRQPETWTAERIAREYQLDPRDVSALLRYFLTFEIKVFPPQDRMAVQPK